GTGTLSVTKTLTSTVILGGANTYTGTSIITAGTLRVSSDVVASTNGPLGNSAAAVQLNGGALEVNTTTFSRAISLTASSRIDAYGAARTVTANISGATFTLTVGGTTASNAAGQDLTLSTGVLSTSMGVTKNFTSTVILSGANTY